MNWSKIIEQALAMLFPLIIVFLFVYYMLKSFFDQFEKQRKQEVRLKFSSETLPIRLQAYERMTLLLERIKPESMIIRNAQPGMTVLDLQKRLLENVREEYEHNLSQQLYVSDRAWSMLVAARQSIMQLISTTAAEYPADDPYMEYATDLLEEYASISDDPLTLALRFLQEEVKELL
ncbi:MAG TPA: hypothetical protein PLK12_04170 [Prolixibacteraceae bacterium]|nr:hypothetical protein [Prolixibacteraceae bacterium]